MGEDLAAYLARRTAAVNDLTESATAAEIEQACRNRGVHVAHRPEMGDHALYVDEPYPLILVGDEPRRETLGHELFHHIIAENSGLGIHYAAPDWEVGDPEAEADRYAAHLCTAESGPTGADIFASGMADLAARLGRPIPISINADALTPAGAHALLAEIERQIVEDAATPQTAAEKQAPVIIQPPGG